MKQLKLPKPNKYGTVSRAALLKLVQAGLIEAECRFHYTDDYAWDAASDFGRHGWLPARITQDRDFLEGFVNFDESDFSTRYRTGGARINEDGTYSFSIHSNLSYRLRIKREE